jgi:hypothetical protein
MVRGLKTKGTVTTTPRSNALMAPSAILFALELTCVVACPASDPGRSGTARFVRGAEFGVRPLGLLKRFTKGLP